MDSKGFFPTWRLSRKNSEKTDDENERRRENPLAENEKNSHNQTLKKTNDTVMTKLESERVKYLRPTLLTERVKYCVLITAMKDERLDFFITLLIKK